MEAKTVAPPFEPDSKKANFDATHELEELLLEDNPLKAKKRGGADLDSLPPEMRQMEEHFLPFDHLKQRRKSYFRGSAKADAPTTAVAGVVEQDRVSQVSSATHTLQDQPLAETATGGVRRRRGARG